MVESFIKESRIAASPSAVFEFFQRPDTFERLLPPGEKVEVLQPPRSLEVGTVVAIRTFLGPIPIEWVVEHIELIPDRLFVDRQIRGPFASWTHRHEFHDDGRGGTILRDVVEYEPPLGKIGFLLGRGFLKSKLQKMFDHRHDVVRLALESTDDGVASHA